MSETMPAPSRRIFVGDVQGCATELEDLLEKLGADPTRDAIYYCGDLVNRGPRSLDALRLARATATEVVLGNHDLHLIARAAGARPPKAKDTLDDVLAAPDRDELLAWLRQRPVIVSWPDIVLVHAAIDPRWTDLVDVDRAIRGRFEEADPLADPDLAFATTARYCDAEGNTPPWEIARIARPPGEEGAGPAIAAPYAAWDTFWTGPQIAVFGHWARRGLVREEFVRGLDSGCVWGGKLTAWVAEEDHFVSVPARATYQSFE